MKRLLAALAVCGFLASLGLESLHRHRTTAPESCALCALGTQTVRHVPDASPAPVVTATSESRWETDETDAPAPFVRQARARSPPSA